MPTFRYRLPATLLLAAGACALAGAALIAADGLRDDARPSDVGIVLGSKVMRDGTPSPRLKARLDKAGELYRQGMFRWVIVSGGTGKEGYSEAKVMAAYLADRYAVPRSAILEDEHGDTTAATARNGAAIMQAHGFASALVVTQFFHITRSRYALHHAGVATIRTAHANYFDARDIYSMGRELVALPSYWLRNR